MFLSPVISHSAKQDVTCSWVYELFTSWTAMGSFIHAELSLVKFLLDENGAARLALTMTLMSVSGAMSALVGVLARLKLRAPSWKHRALYLGLGVGRNTQKVLGRWSFVKPIGSWIRDAGQWGEKQWVTISSQEILLYIEQHWRVDKAHADHLTLHFHFTDKETKAQHRE